MTYWEQYLKPDVPPAKGVEKVHVTMRGYRALCMCSQSVACSRKRCRCPYSAKAAHLTIAAPILPLVGKPPRSQGLDLAVLSLSETSAAQLSWLSTAIRDVAYALNITDAQHLIEMLNHVLWEERFPSDFLDASRNSHWSFQAVGRSGSRAGVRHQASPSLN